MDALKQKQIADHSRENGVLKTAIKLHKEETGLTTITGLAQLKKYREKVISARHDSSIIA